MRHDELIDLLARAGLELGKWLSNCDQIASSSNKERNFLRKDEEATSKVLGIYCSSNEDSIRYSINLERRRLQRKEE